MALLRAAFGLLLFFQVCVCGDARAQTGGGFDLTRNAVSGGGTTFSTGGGYRLGGAVGQPAADTLSGGAYLLRGGFWSQVVGEQTVAPTATLTSTPTFTLSPRYPSCSFVFFVVKEFPIEPSTLCRSSRRSSSQTNCEKMMTS